MYYYFNVMVASSFLWIFLLVLLLLTVNGRAALWDPTRDSVRLCGNPALPIQTVDAVGLRAQAPEKDLGLVHTIILIKGISK